MAVGRGKCDIQCVGGTYCVWRICGAALVDFPDCTVLFGHHCMPTNPAHLVIIECQVDEYATRQGNHLMIQASMPHQDESLERLNLLAAPPGYPTRLPH